MARLRPGRNEDLLSLALCPRWPRRHHTSPLSFGPRKGRPRLSQDSLAGSTLGNPSSGASAAAKGRQVQTSEADRFARTVTPIIDAIRRSGVTSLRGIAEALNDQRIRTARGGGWQVSNVRNVLGRQLAP